MAQMELYIGSTGPFLFDPTKDMPNQSGVSQVALRTEGQCVVETKPTEANHILRLQDLESAITIVEVSDIDNPTELTSASGTIEGAMILAYESGDPTQFTLYAWDSSVTTDDSPWVVKSGSGAWIAIAGKNNSYNNYFWFDGDTVGIKLKRDNYWVYFQPNATYNGLSLYKVATE